MNNGTDHTNDTINHDDNTTTTTTNNNNNNSKHTHCYSLPVITYH